MGWALRDGCELTDGAAEGLAEGFAEGDLDGACEPMVVRATVVSFEVIGGQ